MRVVYAIVAIATGLIVLGGYFAGAFFPQLVPLQALILNWAVILAGAAAIVGIFNLLRVHWEKIARREKGGSYSALLIASMISVFILGLILRPENPLFRQIIVNGIIFPAEAALLGLLTVSLLYAGIRMLRRRADLIGFVFLITAIILILGSATLPFGDVPLIGGLVRPWVVNIFALGGARGILIGVALGSLLTGLRVLFGADRPYGGN
jgi:hypothetical protein